MRGCRGAGLVDVIVTLMLLSIAGIVFTATFPSGFSALRQSEETKKAVALAQQKMEQVKAMGYESLSYANLRAANAIDADPNTSPYEFTSVDNLSSSLASATGTLEISDYSEGVKQIITVIRWKSGGITRSVTVRTLIADKRPWGVS